MQDKEELGLCDPPHRRYLFVSQDDGESGGCWYEFDHATSKKKYIEKLGLKGYLKGIRCFKKDTEKHGSSWKLEILMDAGQPFAIRSGVKTVWARGIILSLATIKDPAEFEKPFTICATPSPKHAKVVFGSVYNELGQKLKFEWDADLELDHIIKYLQGILGDGGSSEMDGHDESDEASDEIPGNHHSGSASAPQSSNLATKEQVRELVRAGGAVGMDETELDRDCRKLYGGRGPDKLTKSEAIEYRRTLMAM